MVNLGNVSMQMLKGFIVLVGVVAHTPTANTQTAKVPERFFMTTLAENELESLCRCDVEIHPLYSAARISIAGDDVVSFLHRENACGFLAVNVAAKKGWLFQSDACNQLTMQLGSVFHGGKKR